MNINYNDLIYKYIIFNGHSVHIIVRYVRINGVYGFMNKILNEKICNKAIGLQLKSIRKMRSMTLQTLADHLNEDQASIQAYEHGTTGLTAAQIYYLSVVFCVPPAYFYCDQEEAVRSGKTYPQKAMQGLQKPNILNRTIGKNIKKRRINLGLAQKDIGNQVGLTFQQIQKYEQGKNRVSLSTAVYISHVLNCSIYDLLE